MSEPREFIVVRYDRTLEANEGIKEWLSRGYEPAQISAASSGPFSDFLVILFKRVAK